MRVLVTGGAGYVGSALVPKLLDQGHEVRVLDLYLFGESSLESVRGRAGFLEFRGDIRDGDLLGRALSGCEAVIHLACVSNDPSVDLDPALAQSVNYDCMRPLVRSCKKSGVRRFIFASSSSLYGVCGTSEVTEETPHRPVTLYNRLKSLCESVLWEEQSSDFHPVSIRPATICGYSPRMRLDLVVNILTNQAFHRRRITVLGGQQLRPNIHIEDMTDLYAMLLKAPERSIAGQAFNAGFANHTVVELAEIVRREVSAKLSRPDITVEVQPSDDIRSYRISSEKLKKLLGFTPRRTVEQAVREMIDAFAAGKVPNAMEDARYYNARHLVQASLV